MTPQEKHIALNFALFSIGFCLSYLVFESRNKKKQENDAIFKKITENERVKNQFINDAFFKIQEEIDRLKFENELKNNINKMTFRDFEKMIESFKVDKRSKK